MIPQNLARIPGKAEVRRRLFMETAWTVFSESGYPNASMDSVVARAGGSKATLYSHFKSKEELLKAVLEARGAEIRKSVFERFVVPEGFVPSVRNFGVLYLDAILNTDLIEVYRIAMAEAKNLNMGSMSYVFGFSENWKLVAEYLDEHVLPDRLLHGGAWTACQQLRGLLEGDLVIRRLSMLIDKVRPKELTAAVDVAVEAFLRIYAPERCGELAYLKDS